MTVQAGPLERALLHDPDRRPDTAPTRGQRTILVIDDDALVLEALCDILREGGHRVLAARDGKFALALIAATAVDLVVTDVSFVGVSTQYLVKMPWGQELQVFEQNTGRRRLFRQGDRVELSWRPEYAFLLDSQQDASAGAEEEA